MTTNEPTNDKKLIAELYVNCVNLYQRDAKHIIKMYCIKWERISNDIKFHEQEEPLKIFKNAHTKWKDKKDELFKELKETEKIINDEIKSLADTQNLLSFN